MQIVSVTAAMFHGVAVAGTFEFLAQSEWQGEGRVSGRAGAGWVKVRFLEGQTELGAPKADKKLAQKKHLGRGFKLTVTDETVLEITGEADEATPVAAEPEAPVAVETETVAAVNADVAALEAEIAELETARDAAEGAARKNLGKTLSRRRAKLAALVG